MEDSDYYMRISDIDNSQRSLSSSSRSSENPVTNTYMSSEESQEYSLPESQQGYGSDDDRKKQSHKKKVGVQQVTHIQQVRKGKNGDTNINI